MTVDPVVLAGMDRARHRRGCAGVVGAMVVFVPLSTLAWVGAADASTVLGAGGLTIVTLAIVALGLQCFRQPRGPTVRAEHESVVIPFSRVGPVILAVLAVGTMIAVSGWAIDGSLLVDEPGRREGRRLLALVVSPVLLAMMLYAVARPSEVRLEPDGVAVRQLGWTRRISWDGLVHVGVVPRSPERRMRLTSHDGRSVDVGTWQVRPTLERLVATVQRLHRPPAGAGPLEPADVVAMLEGETPEHRDRERHDRERGVR